MVPQQWKGHGKAFLNSTCPEPLPVPQNWSLSYQGKQLKLWTNRQGRQGHRDMWFINKGGRDKDKSGRKWGGELQGEAEGPRPLPSTLNSHPQAPIQIRTDCQPPAPVPAPVAPKETQGAKSDPTPGPPRGIRAASSSKSSKLSGPHRAHSRFVNGRRG